MENKYILNDKFGINGIEKVSFTEIINTFSYPDSIEISKDRGSNLEMSNICYKIKRK